MVEDLKAGSKDEIEQIMNEIQDLQKEASGQSKSETGAGSNWDPAIEKIAQEVQSGLGHVPKSFPKLLKSAGSSLSMTIQGDLVVYLTHADTEQSVSLRFKTDTVEISFSDGTELKIPLLRAPYVDQKTA